MQPLGPLFLPSICEKRLSVYNQSSYPLFNERAKSPSISPSVLALATTSFCPSASAAACTSFVSDSALGSFGLTRQPIPRLLAPSHAAVQFPWQPTD